MITSPFSRRQSLQTLGMLALAYALPNLAQPCHANASGQADMDDWLERLFGTATRLKLREISGLQWQEAMDAIYADAPMADLHNRLDFATLRRQIIDQIPEDRGELFHRVALQGNVETAEGTAEPRQVLITKVAHIKKGRSIPPHGHSNMASAFLCISGEFSIRQYDKLEDQAEHLVLRQTGHEAAAGIGTWSSISDYRNNVHWLTANTDDCFLFTCKLIGIERDRPLHGRINVDVRRAETLGTQTIRARKISSQAAAELY